MIHMQPSKGKNSTMSKMDGLVHVDPELLRFQHSRIRPFFSGCGRSLDDTLQSILDGSLLPCNLPPIQVIAATSLNDTDEPCYVSLNNRRLWILKECRKRGLLVDGLIGVRVRQPKSAAELNRYSAANCSLHATVMREAASTGKRGKKKHCLPMNGHGTGMVVIDGEESDDSILECLSSDEEDEISAQHALTNRFGSLNSSSSDDDDTDEQHNVASNEGIADGIEQPAPQLARLAMPSMVLTEDAATHHITQVRSPDESAMQAMEDARFDHEHILCDGMHEYADIIDNSTNPYFPVQLECGVTVYCAPNVLSQCPAAIGDLESDLMDCLNLLPKNLHRLIRRTNVWVNATYQYGPRDSPMVVNHTTAHHHPGWLAWAHDRLDKTYGIEIYNCFDYRRMRLHWNGCGLILHELCHLIHQFALTDGLENVTVNKAYEAARVSGLYANVRRRDWAGKNEDCDLAYAMVDCKEFFSEMSVAYWSKGYRELDQEKEDQLLCCTPPLMEPTVIERVRCQMPEQAKYFEKNCRHKSQSPIESFLQRLFLHTNGERMCNKFYPFTRGQLRNYDPATFCAMSELWKEIASWHDPTVDDDSSRSDGRWCWLGAPAHKNPTRPYSDTVNL